MGTGLGLSVTRNIIDLHKAAINITNRKAGGNRCVYKYRSCNNLKISEK
ncbi:hypothetical protein [Candidatus Scalindua japonica]|nr:hypothetical protein [Candidatus Scalindua japonica]